MALTEFITPMNEYIKPAIFIYEIPNTLMNSCSYSETETEQQENFSVWND